MTLRFQDNGYQHHDTTLLGQVLLVVTFESEYHSVKLIM